MFCIVRIALSEHFVPMTDFAEVLSSRLDNSGIPKAAFARSISVSERTLNHYLNGQRQPKIDALPAIASALGISVGALFDEDQSRDGTAALREEGSGTQPIGASVPVYGWASCGPKGEGPTRAEGDRRLPVPSDLDPTSLFYAIAKGHSMRQEGIPPGSYALIDTSRRPVIGDRVWFRDVVGLTALKRLTGMNPDGVTLRGWMTADVGNVSSFDIIVPPSGVDQLYPIVAVFDRPPAAGKDMDILPDPRATEFQRNTTIDSRIAAALGVDDQADQDTIILVIERLKLAARDAPPIAELSRDIEALSNTLGSVQRWIEGHGK